jgi:hypothetical protein
MVGVPIAGARRARLDVAHHRAGIAADLVAGNSTRRFSHHEQACAPASSPDQLKPTIIVKFSGVDHTGFFASGYFVCIRTMLRATRKPVKRRFDRDLRLPNKNSVCPRPLFINRATVAAR